MATDHSIGVMRPEDYDAVFALWHQCEGVGLTPSDSREAVHAFLARNPGLCLVARYRGQIVGAVACGHDGRRGYLYHLAVAPEHRRHGIARTLVNECLARLATIGIQKVTIVVYNHNATGRQFWRRIGWKDRDDLVVMQKETPVATLS